MNVIKMIIILLILSTISCFGQEAIKIVNKLPKIVMKKDSSNEEITAIGSPCVIKYKEKYYMVYAQGNAILSTDNNRTNQGTIGLAISKDGIEWEKQGTILRPSVDAIAWDNWFLDTPSIYIKDDIIYLYYFGDNDNNAIGGSIGLATSTDFKNWIRVSKDPILSLGETSMWDCNWIESPTVIYDENEKIFHMYYTGVNNEYKVRTGHAISHDGYSWKKDSSNPILSERFANYSDKLVWDGSGAGVATAYIYDKLYLLYVSQSVNDTLSKQNNPSIGLVLSDDFKKFTRYPKNPILTKEGTGGFPNGPYNPTALVEDGKWKIWYETGVGFGYTELDYLEIK